MTIIAAVDGSALGNPGPAGWAWFIDEDHWASGGWPKATNNRGELQAVIEILQAAQDADEDLHILCDSQYAINSITKWMAGWKKRGWKKANGSPVLNDDLMRTLDELMEAAKAAGRTVTFEWVKGHANHPMNERADDLARAAAGAYQSGKEPDAGPGFFGAADAQGQEQSTDSGASSEKNNEVPAAPAESAGGQELVRIWADVSLDIAAAIAQEADRAGVRPQEHLRALIEKAVRG